MSNALVNAAAPPRIVDFHNHYVGPSLPLTALAGLAPTQRAQWETVNQRLADADALISSIERSAIATRVISTPLEFLRERDGDVPPDTIRRINDTLAEIVSRHPGRLYGLATVDAYSGDAGARELGRAVKELGLRGVFVESAKDGLLPDAPEARPTLSAAAELGVPVFLHPVPDAELNTRFKSCGRLGGRLARGTINAAALFALLEGGAFEGLADLRIVVTALALGGVLLAGGFGDGARLRRDTPALTRRHVYVDTTGLDPVMMRAAIDLVGADHVLVGTDWPVMVETAERIEAALAASGLDAEGRRMVGGGNTLRLLRVG